MLKQIETIIYQAGCHHEAAKLRLDLPRDNERSSA